MSTIPSGIKHLVRKAWKPLTANGDGLLSASKFSGKPWLGKDERWPECQYCGKPMQLFLQLNLNEVPEPVRDEIGRGLLQMFYCTSSNPLCEVECEAFFPFAKSELVRIVQPDDESCNVEIPEIERFFPTRLIVGWEEVDDYPNWEEGGELGVHLSDSEWDDLGEQGFPQSGDKLAGWPDWIQSIEYPDCPLCGERMRLVFQIDSNDNLPYYFGDAGCGHITQCKTHREQLAFGWACC